MAAFTQSAACRSVVPNGLRRSSRWLVISHRHGVTRTKNAVPASRAKRFALIAMMVGSYAPARTRMASVTCPMLAAWPVASVKSQSAVAFVGTHPGPMRFHPTERRYPAGAESGFPVIDHVTERATRMTYPVPGTSGKSLAATPHRYESHADAIHREISMAVPVPPTQSRPVQVPEAVIAPAGSTVSEMAFHPGFRVRVEIVDGAPPATAVRVGVAVGVEVAVAVEVGVDVGAAVAVPVGMAVGQVGGAVGMAPSGVGVAVFAADENETNRLRTNIPPGTLGDVTVMSMTPDPDVADDLATTVMSPVAPVVPHGEETKIGLVPSALTEYVAPVIGALVQSTAAAAIAVSTEIGNEIGVGLALTDAVPADGLIPIVTPEALRSSSERSAPTYPVSEEARDPLLEIESVATVRELAAMASGAGFTRTVATRKYPFGPDEPKLAPASYRAWPRVLSTVAKRLIGNGFVPPPVGAPNVTTWSAFGSKST